MKLSDKVLPRIISILVAIILLSVPLAVLVEKPGLHGATIEWDGDSDGDGYNTSWEDPLNWSLDQVPSSGDDVSIDANATVNINAGTTINSLTVSNVSGTTNSNIKLQL